MTSTSDVVPSSQQSSPAAALLEPLRAPEWTPTQRAFRQQVRSFVQQHLTEAVIDECERSGGVPVSLIRQSYAAGLYAMRAPVGIGGTPPPGTASGQRPDAWFEYILVDELSACGAHGVVTELIGNFGMLLPLLDAFASEEMRRTIIQPLVRAESFACFAFTEPMTPAQALPSSSNKQSRVAATAPSARASAAKPPSGPGGRMRMRTTATRRSDGSFELTGEKMFISFAARADYIVTACSIREEGEDAAAGPAPLSLLVVPAKSPGVRVTPLRLHGWRSTSTTRISFERVHVPAALLLVDGSKASAPLMTLLLQLLRSNIQQERLVTAIINARSARVCLEDALEFARRKRIGKDQRLADSSATRQQLVQMAVHVQQSRLMVEELVAAIVAAEGDCSGEVAPDRWTKAIGQQTAMVKYATTIALQQCVQAASLICGSSAIAEGTGPSGRIERLRRDAAVSATTGGNENALLEMVAKRAKL